MFCGKCGNELADGVAFCPSCGQSSKTDAAPTATVTTPAPSRAPASHDFSDETPYYQDIFNKFDAAGGALTPSFNLTAFLFGALWYFFKGMWVKGGAMILLSIFTGGLLAPVFWAYSAFVGNWDLYLLKTKNTQLW